METGGLPDDAVTVVQQDEGVEPDAYAGIKLNLRGVTALTERPNLALVGNELTPTPVKSEMLGASHAIWATCA